MLLWNAGVGDVAVDIPMSWLPEGSVCRGIALQWTTQVHQLLRTGLRLHATAQHSVQSRLCALQDSYLSRQTEMFQVYLSSTCTVVLFTTPYIHVHCRLVICHSFWGHLCSEMAKMEHACFHAYMPPVSNKAGWAMPHSRGRIPFIINLKQCCGG